MDYGEKFGVIELDSVSVPLNPSYKSFGFLYKSIITRTMQPLHGMFILKKKFSRQRQRKNDSPLKGLEEKREKRSRRFLFSPRRFLKHFYKRKSIESTRAARSEIKKPA